MIALSISKFFIKILPFLETWTRNNLPDAFKMVRQGLRNLQHALHLVVGVCTLREQENGESTSETAKAFHS